MPKAVALPDDFGPDYPQWSDRAKVAFLERRIAQLHTKLVRQEGVFENQRHQLQRVAHDREEALSQLQARNVELGQTSRELTELKNHLEEMVRERTRALEEKTVELEEYARSLYDTNIAMDVLIRKLSQNEPSVPGETIRQLQGRVGPALGRLWAAVKNAKHRALITEIFSVFQEAIPELGEQSKPWGIVLTRRESEVAGLVAQGLSNQEIAQRLHLSVRSVHSCTYHIRKKYNLPRQVKLKDFLNRKDGNDFN